MKGLPGYRLDDSSEVAADLDQLRQFHSIASDALYIGPHRSAIAQSSGTYYGLSIGSAFVAQWNEWKTGPTRRNSEAVIRVCADIARVLGFGSLEINASPESSFQVIVDGRPYFLRELGAGISQFIVVLGNVLVRRPSLLLVDEPEIHLHPSLQTDFLLSLAERASYGVIYATHSIGLARTTAHPIYSFRKDKARSVVGPFEQTADFREFLGEMSFAAFQEMGCNTVLMTEGVNEVKALQSLLRLFGRDHQVVVLPMGGDQFFSANREQELAELLRLTPHVAVMIDSERASAGDEIREPRRSFLDRCRALGFLTYATERRAFENYLTTEALRSAFQNDSLSALDPYESLRHRSPNWSKADTWKAARFMSGSDLMGTDLGDFLRSLPVMGGETVPRDE